MSRGWPGSKKVKDPGLSWEEIIEIKQDCDIFDANRAGKINPKELKSQCSH